MNIKIKKLNPDCILPKYMTSGAAAMDVFACIDQPVTIPAGSRVLIPTGFALQLPSNCVALLCARSGLAFKNGICLANGIGVIDSDYTGEVKVALFNSSDQPFTVEKGMRVAQMMISPVITADLEQVDSLEETCRGDGGFGSTGTNS